MFVELPLFAIVFYITFFLRVANIGFQRNQKKKCVARGAWFRPTDHFSFAQHIISVVVASKDLQSQGAHSKYHIRYFYCNRPLGDYIPEIRLPLITH